TAGHPRRTTESPPPPLVLLPEPLGRGLTCAFPSRSGLYQGEEQGSSLAPRSSWVGCVCVCVCVCPGFPHCAWLTTLFPFLSPSGPRSDFGCQATLSPCLRSCLSRISLLHTISLPVQAKRLDVSKKHR